jgi:ribosomal protection tetracycline resistance protein
LHRFRLELPTDLLGPILPTLSRLGAVPQVPTPAEALAAVEGEVPAAKVQALLTQLPGLTRGEGVLETTFDHYEAVRGEPPRRR